jgi:uncharacterized protein (TIGR02594 family)
VKSGDTLWDIAADHHVSLGELLAANPQITNPDLIHVGQVLRLPGNRAQAAGHAVGAAVAGKPRSKTTPPAGVPRWYAIAMDEARHYTAGRQVMYHRQSGVGAPGQDWCSVFANWVMQRAGYTGTLSALASSWMKWGLALDTPRRGAIVVLDDGFMNDPMAPGNPYFHVGFVESCGGGMLRCLGGNQGHAVCYATFHASGGGVVKGRPQRFHFRWPPR